MKGNIIDSFGNNSNSIDCVILNPCHPRVLDVVNDRASVIFADGVDVAIEVKPGLSNKKEIHRLLDQIQSVKKLKRVKIGLININNKYNDKQLEYARQIPCIAFAGKTYKNPRTLVKHIVEYYEEKRVPQNEQFDAIFISGSISVFNFKKFSYVSDDNFEGIAYSETKEDTLFEMIIQLNRFPKCEPTMGEIVMNIYCKNDAAKSGKLFEDLNRRLSNIPQRDV